MFVVTGASGNTGSIVARTLLEAGRRYVCWCATPPGSRLAARGAEVVTGDLLDAGALARALAGASGLYLLSPPDASATDFLAQRRAQLESATRAAARPARTRRAPVVHRRAARQRHRPGRERCTTASRPCGPPDCR